MSQYRKVMTELAKQREAERRAKSRLPPRQAPPAVDKAELARLRAVLEAKVKEHE